MIGASKLKPRVVWLQRFNSLCCSTRYSKASLRWSSTCRQTSWREKWRFLLFRPYFVTAYCTPSWFFWQYVISVFSQKPLANYSRSLTFLFVEICQDKVFTTKKERTNFLFQYNMSRTIGRHSFSKATSSNTKKRIRTSRQEHNEKRDGISFSSCIWTQMTNKKSGTFRATFVFLPAHFVPFLGFWWYHGNPRLCLGYHGKW